MPKQIDYVISESAYYWGPPKGLTPAVMNVNEAYRRSLDPTVCVRNRTWCLDYVFEPWQEERIGSPRARWFPREACTAFLFAPGTAYWEKISQPTRAAWINIRGGEAAGLAAFVSTRRGWAEFKDPDRVLGDHMARMARAAQTACEPGFCAAQAGLWQLLDLLRRAAPGARPGEYRIDTGGDAGGLSPFARDVRAYLAEHLADRISLNDIARHMGVSVSGLSHRYKAELREAPMRSHLRMRLERARQLLLQGFKLQPIAEATGFATSFHLSAMFKQVEGLSPSAYLRMVRKG